MILSDLPSPAEAGFAKAGNRFPLFGIMLYRSSKPVQLWWLVAPFGGFEIARYVHFFAMAAIVGFSVLHIVMALLVPKSLRAMITGR